MSDLLMIMLIILFAPFLIYTLIRIVSSAVFKSLFEQRKEYDKWKGEKDGRQGTPKTDKGTVRKNDLTE